MVRIMDSREIIRQVRLAGWVCRNARGSHHIYVHPPKPGHISVPHPKKDLGIGLAAKLLTQAGLKQTARGATAGAFGFFKAYQGTS